MGISAISRSDPAPTRESWTGHHRATPLSPAPPSLELQLICNQIYLVRELSSVTPTVSVELELKVFPFAFFVLRGTMRRLPEN